MARGARLQIDTVAAEILDHAVLNIQRSTAREADAVGTAGYANAVERYTAYCDIPAASSDGNCASTGRRRYVGPALALDGDGLADGNRAVAAWVKRINFTPGRGDIDGCLKVPARLRNTAWIAVAAGCRDEGAVCLCLHWRG